MNLGRHNAKILKNDVRAAGTGTEFVYLLLEVDGEKIAANIWMSKKSVNMAKVQLRACGFDTASESVLSLKENPNHLTGKIVSIDVEEEEYRGEMRVKARIVTTNVTKKRITQIDEMLKESKQEQPDDDIPF